MEEKQTIHEKEVGGNHQLNDCNMNNEIMLDLTAAPERDQVADDYGESSCYKLPNELLINIFKYLPHSDLQQIRLVCKHWNNIAQLPEFLENSKVVLGPDNIDLLYLGMETALPYGVLSLSELDLNCEELQSCLDACKSSRYKLRLFEMPECEATNSNLPTLKEMVLAHIPVVQNDAPCSVNLSRLKDLEIEMSCSIVGRHLNYTRDEAFKMEKLSIELEGNHEEWFLDTLQYHSNSLKHLEIIGYVNPTLITKWREVFASLRHLEVLQISYLYFLQFMIYLPSEAPLRHCELSGIPQVGNLLLKNIVHKWASSLENIELMFCDNLDDDGIKELGLLRHNLTSLTITHCRKVSIAGLLQGLVAQENNSLTRLILSDMLATDQQSMTLLISRLPRLTYFSLENCRASVTDRTLHYIFHYQRKLQHLILDGCTQITDRGILGFGANPAPVSNLKGLQSLSLMGCKHLSDRTLIEGLRFNEIRKLVLGYSRKITSVGIKELVRNCPSLEALTLSSCSKIDENALMSIATGLSRIRYLNVCNCHQVTTKSLKRALKQCDSIRELSTSSRTFKTGCQWPDMDET